MLNHIENLQQKPESYKKRFAFVVSFLFVAIIFVIWLSAVYPTLTQKEVESQTANVTPFGTVGDSVGQIFDNFGSLKKETGAVLDSVQAVPEAVGTQ